MPLVPRVRLYAYTVQALATGPVYLLSDFDLDFRKEIKSATSFLMEKANLKSHYIIPGHSHLI
jgi:hypothetical protein